MSRREPMDINRIVLPVTAGAAAAVLVFLALSTLASPSGFSGRMGELEQSLGKSEQEIRSSGSLTYAAGSVCETSQAQAVEALKGRVQAAAQAAGVTLASLNAAPGPQGQGGMTLSPVTLQLQASGHYDQVMGLLASLANDKPAIFIDSADLVSKTSSVDLKLQGRVFCSNDARP
ncbi:GspMb/PilO family protein [Caulobacter sp. KR2-114]|uniref:GspMb/PilO family protein n=1 Tax=Caulobacter sp. KR2-114 TaxID=3400912 RepID=UPI003C0B5E40